MLGQIEEALLEQGILDKIKGAFSIVNTIWLLSSLGMIFTFLPASYFLFQPIYKRYKDFFNLLARKLRVFIINKVFSVFVNLHLIGAYEALLYSLCMMLIAQGFRTNIYSGIMISFTGVGFLFPVKLYSFYLWHNKKLGINDR